MRSSKCEVAKIERADAWSKEPPTVQGWYWHWNGDEDSSPIPTSVLWSGTSRTCFVSMGQLGLHEAVECDVYGGFWMPMTTPKTPTII